jgi:hypothetical protein
MIIVIIKVSAATYLEKLVFLFGIKLNPFSKGRFSNKCNVHWKHHQLAFVDKKKKKKAKMKQMSISIMLVIG